MKIRPRTLLPVLVLALCAVGARAQSSCSSDGQPQPVALLERFINADCAPCWSDAGTVRPGAGELALDWIVPGGRGDDAPLSAAASRDATARLEALRRPAPARSGYARHKLRPPRMQLRVAQGLPVGDYIGASIELRAAGAGPWQAWLLLVETIPAGSEGTPVARNLVRNALQHTWNGKKTLSKEEQKRLFESRPMNIHEGANAARLRVVGWVEDARGRIVAAAQSQCRQER